MEFFIFIVVIILVGASLGIVFQVKREKAIKEKYPGAEVITSNNYYVIEKDGLILVKKGFEKNEAKHIRISKINEVKIYEDGKESSASKAVIGGLAFGIVGTIVGASIKTQFANKMGIKLYTNNGIFDINFLNTKTKKNSLAYKVASNNVDCAYNLILKYN